MSTSKCSSLENFLIGHFDSISNFYELLWSEYVFIAKGVKSNMYNKRIHDIPVGMTTSQIQASALKKIQCVAEQNFVSSLVAEVGTNACKFGINERNRIVNFRNEPIAVIFEFWYFLPSVCEQFYR